MSGSASAAGWYLQLYLPLLLSPLSVEIPTFLPVPFLPGAKTSLLAAPGSLHAQDLPGGPVASGLVSAAPAKRLAPFPAAQLRGRPLLRAAVPVPLCLSVQMFHPCWCSLCRPAHPFSLHTFHQAMPAPRAKPDAVPVPASLVHCLLHLFWSILVTHTNQDNLPTH